MVSRKRIASDFKVFSRGYLRNKFGLFFGLIFPVILILIFGAIFSGGSSGTLNVYTQNNDNGPIATSFLTTLNQSTTIRVITVNTTDFSKYLADHSVSDGIIIPENFSADYLAGHQVNVTVYGNPSSASSGIVSGTVNGYANYFNLNYYKQNATPIIGIKSATVNTQQTKYIDFLIPGLIG
ncbi:MAG: ABC transporter permease, partial [Bacteriovorax sp.]